MSCTDPIVQLISKTTCWRTSTRSVGLPVACREQLSSVKTSLVVMLLVKTWKRHHKHLRLLWSAKVVVHLCGPKLQYTKLKRVQMKIIKPVALILSCGFRGFKLSVSAKHEPYSSVKIDFLVPKLLWKHQYVSIWRLCEMAFNKLVLLETGSKQPGAMYRSSHSHQSNASVAFQSMHRHHCSPE